MRLKYCIVNKVFWQFDEAQVLCYALELIFQLNDSSKWTFKTTAFVEFNQLARLHIQENKLEQKMWPYKRKRKNTALKKKINKTQRRISGKIKRVNKRRKLAVQSTRVGYIIRRVVNHAKRLHKRAEKWRAMVLIDLQPNIRPVRAS